MQIEGRVGAELAGSVSRYCGFREETPSPVVRHEGPGYHVVVIVSFGEEWLIDGERLRSFVGGLRDRQVTTRHEGRSFGIHIDLVPPAAHRLFGLPLRDLAYRQLPLEDVLDEPFLVERLHDAGTWAARFRLLDSLLARRLRHAPPPSPQVLWAWRRLVGARGDIRVGSLAEELGWSRKRLVTRFGEEIGLPPKAIARVLRFERARALAEAATRPDWARIAVESGYYDQSHLINDFRAFSGRTPGTFFQDGAATAA
ncbi:MAG TPA: helix-turn-helix domain-containing protein [Gaiellaceae bacterium]|nr:helix-turn-helix domain-containing protein [Gaiellaceae bacterium]